MNKPTMKSYNKLIASALIAFFASLLAAPCSGQENDRSAETELSAFRLIFERNIFNPNRQKVEEEKPVVVEKPQADEISLVGVLVTETQRFAFFDGSSSAYRRVLSIDAEIGGGTIEAIDSTSIKLRLNDEALDLPVGMGLIREEGQAWQMQNAPRRVESKPQNNETRTQPTPANELLRKLMERRNQEQSQ